MHTASTDAGQAHPPLWSVTAVLKVSQPLDAFGAPSPQNLFGAEAGSSLRTRPGGGTSWFGTRTSQEREQGGLPADQIQIEVEVHHFPSSSGAPSPQNLSWRRAGSSGPPRPALPPPTQMAPEPWGRGPRG